MAKAVRIFSKKFVLKCQNERLIVVFMDLYKLPSGHSESFPEGYKFSWVAFDPNHEFEKVLLDCHPPKGPHLHVNDDVIGEAFKWTSLEVMHSFFFAKIRERFGAFTTEED